MSISSWIMDSTLIKGNPIPGVGRITKCNQLFMWVLIALYPADDQ